MMVMMMLMLCTEVYICEIRLHKKLLGFCHCFNDIRKSLFEQLVGYLK